MSNEEKQHLRQALETICNDVLICSLLAMTAILIALCILTVASIIPFYIIYRWIRYKGKWRVSHQWHKTEHFGNIQEAILKR